MFANNLLSTVDPIISAALAQELLRQENNLSLIASENYASPAVLTVQGSVLTNKYAEGYPGQRYYGGCEVVDVVENCAIERAKQLFSADYANVQPHSGSQANSAVYLALLAPGDSILGMGLAYGGHLTHGSKVNFSGKNYLSYSYGVDAHTGEVDYQIIEELALKYHPKIIVAGFSAYSRILHWKNFRDIADKVGAYLVADIAHVAGLIAAGVYPSPIDLADVTTSTTHKTLRGPRGGLILAPHNPQLAKKLNSAIFPGTQGGPLMHSVAAKAVAFHEALQPEFVQYQQQVIANAQAMAKICQQRSYQVLSGGTDNHMFLIDLSNKDITGQEAERVLGRANLILNKNSVPNDKQKPTITSGIRVGTPAITTRGLGIPECITIANWLCDILDDSSNIAQLHKIQAQVVELCNSYPIYAASANALS